MEREMQNEAEHQLQPQRRQQKNHVVEVNLASLVGLFNLKYAISAFLIHIACTFHDSYIAWYDR